jgi:hypothetical protein
VCSVRRQLSGGELTPVIGAIAIVTAVDLRASEVKKMRLKAVNWREIREKIEADPDQVMFEACERAGIWRSRDLRQLSDERRLIRKH